MSLMKVENLSVAYPAPSGGLSGLFRRRPPGKLALDDINFTVDVGERLALVGLNGSGKSTLLRSMAGIYQPLSGRVVSDSRIAALFNLGIGMQMESTGRRNILLQAMIYGFSSEEAEAIIPEVIEFSELGEVIDTPIHTYSQGMVMRLSFAIATSISPEILLLDEWIGAGDRIFRARARARLEAMVSDAGAFVLASHNASIVRRYCTKGIWLHKGKIVMYDDVEAVLEAFESATNE